MSLVTSDFLSGVLTDFRALFAGTYMSAAGRQNWLPLAIPIDASGVADVKYTWFGSVSSVKKVTHDTVEIKGLPRFNFTIENEEWQNAIEVERAALERDQLNLIRPRINQLARRAADHPGRLIKKLFVDNPLAFDGVAYFANTRVIGESANIDNILTGTGVTVAAFQADLATADAQMRLFQDDAGEEMGLVGNVIVVPPALRFLAFQAANPSQGAGLNQVIPRPDAEPSGSDYTIIVDEFLSDANDWYLCHDGGAEERPFVFQTEKEPELLGDTDPNSRVAIEKRTFVYSGYGRYNAGVTDPRFAVKTTNT